MATEVSEMRWRPRIGVVLVAAALALAVAILLFQARSIWSDPMAAADVGSSGRVHALDASVRPGADRGQVRVGPISAPLPAIHPHTTPQRPKWAS